MLTVPEPFLSTQQSRYNLHVKSDRGAIDVFLLSDLRQIAALHSHETTPLLEGDHAAEDSPTGHGEPAAKRSRPVRLLNCGASHLAGCFHVPSHRFLAW